MEELFDSFECHGLSSGNGFLPDYESNAGTSVQNQERILEELCQLTDELPTVEQVANNEVFNRVSTTEPRPNAVDSKLKLQDPPVIDEILSLDESAIAATSHNVAVINVACQQVLKEMEQQLLALLKQNRKDQELVQNFLSTNGKITDPPKKMHIKCAGMPYFKDLDGYPPPQNEDVLKKKARNKLLPADFIENSPVWNSSDAKALVKAVNSDMNLKLSMKSNDPIAIDWMKISATDMEGKYSPSECKSKWFMNLSPDINKSKWSAKEIKDLELIAAQNNYQDWDTIAWELGTRRSSLQCCVQYQAHRPPSEGKWTKEEDEALKNLIEKYRVRDYIPWVKVTWHFEKRSLRQCQERYAYHLVNIKKGSFSTEEDFILTYLATKVKNFGEVAKYLPKRVSPQVRARYEYLVQVSMPKFTKQEDKLLSELMVKYPRNWSKISEFFDDRSTVQCRKRWAHLQKSIKLSNVFVSESESEDIESPTVATKNTPKDIKDAENVVKNLDLSWKPEPKSRRYPEEYTKLLDYHKHCHKFLFGPKPRIPSGAEECERICKKMRVTMRYLSVGEATPSTSFDTDSLLNDCEFSAEDVAILNQMKKSAPLENAFELSHKIIPPNYMTLVGLRTLLVSWNKVRGLCGFSKDPRQKVESGDRVLCSDAKKLFKARMKALFAFPLLMSNISQEGIQSKPVPRSKVVKRVKPLSRRRRRAHAKLMTKAYREKLLKRLDESRRDEEPSDGKRKTSGDEIQEGGEETPPTKTAKRRGRPRKSDSDRNDIPPVKRSKRNAKT